jgi:hypothetical protein
MECSYLVDSGVGVLAVLDDSVVRLRNGQDLGGEESGEEECELHDCNLGGGWNQ